MVIGTPNYLRLSPYQISSPVRSISSPIASHWFLIQVISSIIDISTFGNSKNIHFSTENMVSNGWFRMYLNHDQVQFLKDSTYFELYPIEMKHKISTRQTAERGDYFVHASSDWTPPEGATILTRVSDTIFYVRNLLIDQNVMNDPRVLQINPIGTKELLNRYVSGYLQGGHQKSYYHNNIFAPTRPLHEIGINGTGQVINVVDSGVDVLNAFFYDPSPENTLESITNKTNVNHRKVIRIEAYVDNTDYKNGHGTHVAGTAAGSSYCTDCGIQQYNGIASGAKLYFSDIGNSTSLEVTGDIDLVEQAKIFKELDVHVSSNSWGFSTYLSEVEFRYNKAAYDNPYILYVFAAGNSKNYNTIYCPANAKNVATVGSVEQVSSTASEFSSVEAEVQNSTFKFTVYDSMTKLIRGNSVGPNMKYYVNLTLVDYREPYLEPNCTEANCSEKVPDPDFDAATYYKGKAVIVNTEVEDDEELCIRAQNAADFGAEVAFYLPNVTFYVCKPIPTFPMLNLLNADNIDHLKQMGTLSILPPSGDEVDQVPAATYQASKGPADNGLRKPDIATPGGNVFSAKSHGYEMDGVVPNASFNDNVLRLSGTSMATPQVSALAILIVQYLRDGFYPGLEKGSGESTTPSSCLMRGILVNTADKPPNLLVRDSKSEPRNDVGFGVPCLERALGLNGVGFRFVDNEIMPSKSHKIYKIELDSNLVDLNVTMSYLDPPLNPENEAIFFADLDLFIKSPNGKFYMGNDMLESESFSTTERIIIDKEEIPSNGGVFEIHILSSDYPIQNQKVTYSIVVNGPFEQKVSDRNPLFLKARTASHDECVNNCNNNGLCAQARCICNEGFIGSSCNTTVTTLIDKDSYDFTYNQKQIKYYKLFVDNSRSNTIGFGIKKNIAMAPAYFCISFELNPGKISNSGWDCHLVCSQNDSDSDEYLDSCNYTFRIPRNKKENSVFMAIYTGYYQPMKVSFGNITFYHTEYEDELKERKIIFIAGIIILIVIFVVFIAIIIVIAIQTSVNKKSSKEMNNSLNHNSEL